MKVKSITSFGESVVFQMENGETYSMAEIEKMIAEMRKPKPLLADAQVGWLCEMSDGTYNQIKEIVEKPNLPKRFVLKDEVRCKHKGSNSESVTRAFQEDGTYYSHFCGKEPEFTTTIISCEPLAKEGTAEWAWQMMLLGKDIIHSEYTHKAATWKMINGTARTCLSGMSADSKEVWLKNAIWNGWQLYAPQPQFKVGDWVEYMGCQLMLIGIPIGETIPDIKSWFAQDIDGNEVRIYTDNITRKLDPAEVKVSITLSGTVEKVGENKTVFRLNYGDTGHDYQYVDYASLTPADAEMVRGLVGGGE